MLSCQKLYCRYLDRIIRSSELRDFSEMLQLHQKALTADGWFLFSSLDASSISTESLATCTADKSEMLVIIIVRFRPRCGTVSVINCAASVSCESVSHLNTEHTLKCAVCGCGKLSPLCADWFSQSIHFCGVKNWLYLYQIGTSLLGWLVSRVLSMLDSGTEGPGFKSQPRRYQITVLGKLFTPIVPLFTKQRNW